MVPLYLLINCISRILMDQMIKNLAAMQETWVLSLCWEAPLQKEMATHFCILSWRIPWTEKPGGLESTTVG